MTARLINLIEKKSLSYKSIFFNIMEDLCEYQLAVKEILPLTEMAIAYTKRGCLAGNFIQGFNNYEDYDDAQKEWLDIARKTENWNSKNFQVDACNQSIELFKSYDIRLDKVFISLITTAIAAKEIVSISDMGIQISLDKAIDSFGPISIKEENIGQQTIHLDIEGRW